MEEGMTFVSIIKFSCEVRITSIKVADDSVTLVGCVIIWDKLKDVQKLTRAWEAGSDEFNKLQWRKILINS